jgi:hypothetical protein
MDHLTTMTTEKLNLSVPVSPEQEDIIADHLLLGTELGMPPDERVWMITHAQRKHPGCRITAAELDVLEGNWNLTLEEAQ